MFLHFYPNKSVVLCCVGLCMGIGVFLGVLSGRVRLHTTVGAHSFSRGAACFPNELTTALRMACTGVGSKNVERHEHEWKHAVAGGLFFSFAFVEAGEATKH
ncbi:hypothetical protein TRVL_04956 [Trypanosoma vivax]|nr:hypothetical protein TRVL_04956 [Trypanosoma vivax]